MRCRWRARPFSTPRPASNCLHKTPRPCYRVTVRGRQNRLPSIGIGTPPCPCRIFFNNLFHCVLRRPSAHQATFLASALPARRNTSRAIYPNRHDRRPLPPPLIRKSFHAVSSNRLVPETPLQLCREVDFRTGWCLRPLSSIHQTPLARPHKSTGRYRSSRGNTNTRERERMRANLPPLARRGRNALASQGRDAPPELADPHEVS